MRHPGEDRRRRFTLLDTLILMALLAQGIKAHQTVAATIAEARLPAGPVSAATVIQDVWRRGFLEIPVHALYWFEIAMPWVITLSISLLVLRMIPPRPARVRLARQPGFAAIAMASGSPLLLWRC